MDFTKLEKEYMTITEVAALMDVSRIYVYQLVKANRMPSKTFKGTILVLADDAKEYNRTRVRRHT